MGQVIDVNSDALVKLSKKLEGLNRSAFPITVRQTLNTFAFETKKRIPTEAKKIFVTRNPGFWNAFSRVEKAKGFNVNSMVSKAGMTEGKKGKKSEQAGRNLKQQQLGGKIDGRTFVPKDSARVGGKRTGKVRKENRLSALQDDFKVAPVISRSDGSSGRQQFLKTSIYAAVHGKKLIRSSKMLYRIQRGRGKYLYKTAGITIGVTPLYSIKKGRSVDVEAKPFVRRIAKLNGKKGDRIFAKHAEKQFKKAMA